ARRMEPMERVTLEIDTEHLGAVSEALARRRGEMLEIEYADGGLVRLDYVVPTRGLIGFRNAFLTLTGGRGIMGAIGLGYRPWAGELSDHRHGALPASSGGKALTYG